MLLEWDSELARRQQASELRSKLLSVASGLSLAACVGGLVGYQWHKRTMGEAKQATSAALKKADAASDELHRAGTTLDKIIADPSLGAVEKARKITEVVETLEAQTASACAGQRAPRARAEGTPKKKRACALSKRKRRSTARSRKRRPSATWPRTRKPSPRRPLGRQRPSAIRRANDKASADGARAKAERERTQAQQDKAASDSARLRVEAERDRLEAEKNASEAAKLNAEAELALARQNKAAELKAAFDKGVETGFGARRAPAPAP